MLVYPLTVEDGKLKLTYDTEDIVRMSIVSAVMTVKQERVMRPSYGRGWQPFDRATLPDILRDCRQAIEEALVGLPPVQLELFATVNDEGQVTLDVYYAPGSSIAIILDQMAAVATL